MSFSYKYIGAIDKFDNRNALFVQFMFTIITCNEKPFNSISWSKTQKTDCLTCKKQLFEHTVNKDT